MRLPPRFALPGPLPLRVVAVVLTAALLPVIAPPLNLHWLQWISFAPMMLVLDPQDQRTNVRLSWLYGAVAVGLIFQWITYPMVDIAGIPAVLALAVLLLFALVFGAPYMLLWPTVHPLRRAIGPAWIFVFAALEVVVEWLSMWALLFPYQHGNPQYRFPYTFQLASITGVWGVSYLVFLVNGAIAEAVLRWREREPYPRAIGGAVGAIVALVVVFSSWRYHWVSAAVEESPVIRVAQLQSDRGMEYRMSHSPQEAWSEWMIQTRRVPAGAADLVVWPEGASPFDLNSLPEARDLIAAEARRGGWEMVVGAGTRLRQVDPTIGEERVTVFNSVYFFEKDGDVQGHYDKIVPLPFGEYVPLRGVVPDGWIRAWADMLHIGDFQAGEEAVVFEGEAARIATPICYEAILPRVCRMFREPTLLVNITNDAWFGTDANPYQHAMLAAARSTELGVPLVRVAYTGVSMIVEPDGDISAETEPFARVNRVVPVHTAHVPTVYAAIGDWFPALCLLAAMWGVSRARHDLFPARWLARLGWS